MELTTRTLYEQGILDAKAVIRIALLEAGWTAEEQEQLMAGDPTRKYRKFTDEENEGIREMYESGVPLAVIEAKYNLSRSHLTGRVSALRLRRPVKV